MNPLSLSSDSFYTGDISNQPQLGQGEMDFNTLYMVCVAACAVFGLIRYIYALNDGDSLSINQSENNFDFNFVFNALIIGVIGIFVWLLCGGMKMQVGPPPVAWATSGRLSSTPVTRSLMTRALLGRTWGGTSVIHPMPSRLR
jgi:hypothetical protein